ncbi:MAG: hypothetical protein WC356_00405 [Candidatus Micrarchaeia archaeon]|jgi:hypothetical protein
MFKHKTVRKIAKYITFTSVLNFSTPLVSTLYASQIEQKDEGKPLKTQNVTNNLGNAMTPELKNIPQELNTLTSIYFLKDLKEIIIEEYKELIKTKSENESLKILIYAIIESIKSNNQGSKTYYVTKDELKHALVGTYSSKNDLQISFNNFENEKEQIFKKEDIKEAEKRINILKTFCEDNDLIAQPNTNLNKIPEKEIEKSEKKINVIETKAEEAIEIMRKIVNTPVEDIQTLQTHLSEFDGLTDDYRENGYTGEKGNRLSDYKTAIENKIKELIKNDLELRPLINLIEKNGLQILDESTRTTFLSNYKKTIQETNEIVNDFTNIFLNENEVATITATKTIENLPEYLKTNLRSIIDNTEYTNYGTTEQTFISNLFEIFEKTKEKIDVDDTLTFSDALDLVLNEDTYSPHSSNWFDLIFYGIYTEYLNGTVENRENALNMLNDSINQLRNYGTYYANIENPEKTIEEIIAKIDELEKIDKNYLDYILSKYYGQNGELLESVLDIKLKGENTLDKFKNALLIIENDKEKEYYNKWINLVSTNPDLAITAISQRQFIFDETETSILSRREFDAFSMIALSKAYEESEVLQNLKEEEYLSLIAYSIRFPPYYSILLFENHKLIDSIFSQISNHSEQINILNIIDQHIQDIYIFSSNDKRIENIKKYLSADIKKISGTLATNLEGMYLETGNEINIKNQRETINTEYVGDVYNQFNQFSMFSVGLDISQDAIFNNRQGILYQKGNVRTYISNPSFLESRLQFRNSSDRIISGLYAKYYEIMSTKEKMSFDRVVVEGKLDERYGTWNDYETGGNVYLSGPKGETLRSSIDKNKRTTNWDNIGATETIEETDFSLNANNAHMGALDFTKFLFDLNEDLLSKGEDGILEISQYDIRSNLDLIANVGQGNFSIQGILDNSIDTENNTDSRLRYLNTYIRYGAEKTNWIKIKVDVEKLEKYMETNEFKEKYHIYQESMNYFSNIGIHLGTESIGTKEIQESTNTEFALGFFISGEIPITENTKSAGLVISTKEGEYNISSSIERKDVHVFSVGASKISDEEFESYSSLVLNSDNKLTFKKDIEPDITEISSEYLLKDKLRALSYFQTRENQGVSGGGAGVSTKFLNSGILYEYYEEMNNLNWKVSGSLKLNIKNTKYISKTFALEEEGKREYGTIHSFSNEKLEFRIFGKISEEISKNTNLLRTNKAEAFLNYLETLEIKYSNYVQNLKTLKQNNSDNYIPTKMQYEQELANDFKSLVSALRSFDIDVYGNAPQQLGIQFIDKKNQTNIMITFKSTDYEDPENETINKRLFLSGITGVNTKAGDFSLMLGTFVDNKNVNNMNPEEISNLVGLKYQRPKLTLSLYGTNINKQEAERGYGAGLSLNLSKDSNKKLNLDYLRIEPNLWHIETAIGDDRNSVLFDYGKIRDLEYLGMGGKLTITERIALEGLINWSRNSDGKNFRTFEADVTGWYTFGKNSRVGLSLNELEIKGKDMEETVFEGRIRFETSF